MRWPEALELIQGIWKFIPDHYKTNHQLKRVEQQYQNWDCSKKGFEGIRAQDILPLLVKKFSFRSFLDSEICPTFSLNAVSGTTSVWIIRMIQDS